MDDLTKLITKSGAEPVEGPVTFATTGLVGLDWAMGGGVARGRLAEFSGLESSGKSTIGLQTGLTEALRTGLPALWMDYEYAWDTDYVAGLIEATSTPEGAGDVVRTVEENFKVAQPESIEQGFELAIKALEQGWVSSVWFDSTGAMVSEEKGVATSARAFAQHLPFLTRPAARAGVPVGFISQTREVISQGFGGWGQGPKRKATGGTALKFYFSQRVEFTMIGKLKGRGHTVTGAESDSVIGRRIRAKVIKNKVAVPLREIELDIIDGYGFDPLAHNVELAIELGVITQKGAWFEVPGIEKQIQGQQSMLGVLRDPRAEEVRRELSRKVLAQLGTADDSRGVGDSGTEQQEVSDADDDD